MKIVLFTQRVEIIESYNERRDCSDQRIPYFLSECGFLPIPVPNNPELATAIADQTKPCGIVLTGGNTAVKYGGNAPERDSTDKALIDFAIKNNIPLFGFCRGMQSILDYFGNELVAINGHVAKYHKVLGEEEMFVNSFHNYGCKNLTNDNLVTALISEDGVIEKVRHKHLPIAGIMWHPEREQEFKEIDLELVKALFNRR